MADKQEKVFSVTVEVKTVVRALSAEDAFMKAMDKACAIEDMESTKIVNIYEPASGLEWTGKKGSTPRIRR